MYALGATLYYGITGEHVPGTAQRHADAQAISRYPGGRHGSLAFQSHLEALLALAPHKRPPAKTKLDPDSQSVGYTGTVRLDDHNYILVDTASLLTRLVSAGDALEWHRAGRAPSGESDYWIPALQKPSGA
jgi:hypothetical protein